MQKTREEIIKRIGAASCQTVAELAVELGLAPATVRRHLDILQRDGFLEFEERRAGAGRPEHVFSLTVKGLETGPREYDRMLSELVDEIAGFAPDQISGRNGSEVIEHAFERIADRVLQQRAAGGPEDPQERLLGVLRERRYEPEIVAEGGTVQIRLNNCPYRSAAMNNPAICSFDSRLIASALGAEFARSGCIRQGDTCCLYEAGDDLE